MIEIWIKLLLLAPGDKLFGIVGAVGVEELIAFIFIFIIVVDMQLIVVDLIGIIVIVCKLIIILVDLIIGLCIVICKQVMQITVVVVCKKYITIHKHTFKQVKKWIGTFHCLENNCNKKFT